MNKPNFHSDKDGDVYVQKFKIVYRGGKAVYLDKSNKELVDSEGKPLSTIIEKGDYEVAPVSGSREQRKKMHKYLKERSNKHYKKEVEERKKEIIKNSTPPLI